MILENWLAKLGVKPEEMIPEEKKTYETYKAILSKEELTIKEINEFLQDQITVIESRWKDLNIEQSKKSELIHYHTIYKTLLAAINAPRIEREVLENYLNKLIHG